MERPRLGSMRRESTAEMTANIGRELLELKAALAACRGDLEAEPRVSAALMVHLLVSSRELLQNLLIDNACRLRRLGPEGQPGADHSGAS